MAQAYNIPYDSKRHKDLLGYLMSRVKMAETRNTELQKDWDDADKECRAYVPQTDELGREKSKRDSGKNDLVQITLPYSTALLATAYTYWSSVFLSRSPVWQFQALSGGDQTDELAIESLHQYQLVKGRQIVPLHIWLWDVGKYGRGIIGNYWDKESKQIAELVEEPVEVGGVPILDRTSTTIRRTTFDGYVGNKLYNIRPHDFLPDPRVSLSNFQDGEFCGVMIRNVNSNTIRRRKAAGLYFNTEQLMQAAGYQLDFPQGGSPDAIWPATDNTSVDQPRGSSKNFNLVELYVDLIPAQWGLGSETQPEKWVFTVGNRAVIVGARPMGYYHDKFPFSVLEYELDGYTLSGRGIMKLLSPLNYTMSWLLNSHLYNVRAALNGTLVVDPSRLVMGDLTKKGPGRLLRLSPSAYGADVRGAANPLEIPDMTRNNLQDMTVIVDLMQRIIGVNDQVMGMLDTGGRKTATEVRTSSTFGINRLKVNSEYFSAMGFDPLADMMLSNSQQYYEADMKLKVVGDQMQGQGFTAVNPETIAGDFSFLPVDGTLPLDRFAQAAQYKELVQLLMADPGSAEQWDMGGLISWILQLGGIKNINRFKIQTNVLQPGQAPPSNLVPLSGRPPGQPPVGNVGSAGAAG